MVRNYKPKKLKKYTLDELHKAVEDVRNKKMTTYQAAEFYGIPRSTILSRINVTRAIRAGRPAVFSVDFESKMAEYLHLMEIHGFPLTRKESKVLIAEYVRRNGMITPFKNEVPGKDWFLGFQKRHHLSIKKPQSVEVARRKACDPFIIYQYFDMLEKVVEDLGLSGKPQQIFNLDETSICSDPVKGKIIGKKGYRSTRTTSGPGRHNTTVLLAVNANGDKVPALIIFQGKHLWSEWLYKNPQVKTAYSVSERGWMETSIFEKYMKEVFVPAIGKERPVLLIFDGHSTHVDLNVVKYAASEGITILKLPPHSSDILQPLDCSGMKPLKDRWEEKIIQWQRLHIGVKLPRNEFARILTEIWDELNPVILQNGFKKTGVYPVNRFAISKESFDMLALQKWEYAQAQLTENIQQQSADVLNNAEEDSLENDQAELRDVIELDALNFFEYANESYANTIPTLLILTLKTINDEVTKQQLTEMETETNSNDNLKQKSLAKKSRLEKENYVKNKSRETIPQQSKKQKNEKPIKENYSKEILQIKKELNSNPEQTSTLISQEPVLRTYERKIMQDSKKCDKHCQIAKNTPIQLKIPRRLNASLLPNSLKILETKIIKPAQKIEESVENPNISFEELLLKTIGRNDLPKSQKKRITNNKAEVLTYPNVIQRMTTENERKENIRLEKLENKEAKLQKKDAKLQKKQTKKTQQKQEKKLRQQKDSGINQKKKNPKKKYQQKNIDFDDSNSTGSYKSLNESEDEDVESYFRSILLDQDIEENISFEEYVTTDNIIKRQPNTLLSCENLHLVASSSKIQHTVNMFQKTQDPEEGQFILVKFHSSKGKKTYQYVCLIEELTDGKVAVQAFKSYKKSKQVFRIIENDHSVIDNDDIIRYLPEPEIKGSEYIFPCKIDVIEY